LIEPLTVLMLFEDAEEPPAFPQHALKVSGFPNGSA